MGSPPHNSKFTAERCKVALAWLRLGNFRQTAAYRAGVHPQTLGRWIARGERELQELEHQLDAGDGAEDGADAQVVELSDYAKFYLDVSMVEAEVEGGMVSRILDSKDLGDIRWFMERRWPHRYGSGARRVEITGANGAPLEVKVQDARKALATKLLGALGRELGEGAADDPAEGASGPGPEGRP